MEQGYITEAVSKKENINMIADLGSAAVLGFVLGPLVGLLATLFNFQIGAFFVNSYSACGYIQAIFTIVMLIGALFFFTEIPRELRCNHL